MRENGFDRWKNSGWLAAGARFGKRAFAVVLAIAVILTSLTVFPMQAAEAADDGVSVNNAYILEVATGVSDGKMIEFLEIRYTGTDNKKHKQFLFPNEDSLSNGLKDVKTIASDLNISDVMDSTFGYAKSNSAYPWDAYGQGSGLKSNSIDQYYFTTPVPIKSVQRIEGFMGDKGTWTCLRMQLYKVNKLGGIRMAGVWSDTWYVDFEGDLIAELTSSQNNWSRSDAMYLRTDQLAVMRTSFNGVNYAHHEMQSKHPYIFRMDFADTYGAGFESLVKEYGDGTDTLLNQNSVAEMMTYTITYVDVYGKYRFVRLPVITSAAYWISQKKSDARFWGIAQQGETLAFEAELPDCDRITKVEVTIGSEEALKEAGIKRTKNSNAIQNRRVTQSETDDIRLTCMAIYDGNNSSVSVKQDGAQLSYSFTGNPILYNISGDSTGTIYQAKVTLKDMRLRNYDGKSLEVPDNREYYLVQIVTDDISNAATKSDIYMRLNYVNGKGAEATTSEIMLSKATQDYFGYWPGDTDNFAYKWGVNSGNTIYALVTLNDVDYFTGIKLRMKEAAANTADDDYQSKSFQIYSVKPLGKRKVTWQNGYNKSLNGMRTRINIERTAANKTSAVKILDIDKSVLIQQGKDIQIDFESLSVDNIVENSWDMENYQISYEEAMQDFNFTKIRKTYTVTVNVYDDSVETDDYGNVVSSGGNGDAGSENLFYFQLLFADGSSCYELANTQLAGDRFASGAAESFQISTNQDYGEVTGIRIIPDDTSQDSKKYDKLRIDSIKVTESGVTGTHDCWVANDVGWIGTNYTEEKETTSSSGRKGRTAAQMGKTKTIDYTTKVVQLEVAIYTKDTEQDEGYANQFYGKMSGQFTVVLNNGERKQLESFDLVEKMYEYINKKSGSTKGSAVSNKSTMFRVGHTDRFLVDIDDVKEIVSLDLTMEAVDLPYNWAIGGVTVKLVTDKGVLRMNANDEYDYQRDKEPEVLCTQKSEENPPHLVKAKKGKPVTENILFTDNSIELDGEYGKITSKISRVPASKNDELNVFVFPTIGKGESYKNYELDLMVNYAHVYGPIYQTGNRMKKYEPGADDKTGRPMFYLTGLKAEGMIDLNKVTFTALTKDANLKMCYLDYAIIQQVRDDTVIANYYINIGDLNAYYTIAKFATSDPAEIGFKDEQLVSFQFGPTTETRNLFPEKMDMAVALRYKLAGGLEGEYQTPYVYLTDQNINSIRAGQVVDLKFKQMFVGEVVGIRFATMGDIEATVDAACVITARTDTNGKPTQKQHYNFANGLVVSQKPVTVFRTSVGADDLESIHSVTFGFKTSEAGKNEKSGTNGPVFMRLYTADSNGTVNAPDDKDDIRRYIVGDSDNFETDQLQYVRFLVKGASSIRRIELEPKSADFAGNGGWTLDYITARLDTDEMDKRIVGERIYEGTPKRVTFANVTAKAYVSNWNASRNAYDRKLVQDKGIKLIAEPEKQFIIEPIIQGSELGNTVNVVEVIDDEYETGELANYLKKEGVNYIFTPPKQEKTKYYRITVASAEVPEAKVLIELTVEGVEIPKTSTESTGATGGESTGATGGESTGEAGGESTGA